MNKLVFANLLHRPLRSVISVFAVAIEVVMILSIVAIFMGMLDDQKERTNGIGADLMMRPSNSSIMNGVSGAPMTVKIAEPLRKLPHVVVVSPAIFKLSTQGTVEVLYGIDYASFNALRPFVYLAGGPFTGPYDVIVDDVYAGSTHHVGESIEVMGKPFRICGIVEHGRGGRKLIPIDTMGEMIGSEGKASIFYIKVDDDANQQAVIDEIHAVPGLANYPVQTMEEWMSEMTPDKLPGFNIALNTVITIAVVIGFLVIFQTMYTAVLERTREIGILKSLGASKAAIVTVVLRETAILAIAGILFGVLGTYGVRVLVAHTSPTLHFEIILEWIGRAALIAFVGSVLGALYPGWMAARKDPIDALAYE
jgi:putative ABC transport system permease protein